MNVCWFSGGVSSAIATKTALENYHVDNIIYIDIADQHEDTLRFVHDCEEWFGHGVDIIRSKRFSCVDDVITKTRYINGVGGAPCTLNLKKRVRQEWETAHFSEPLTYFWGYDSDETRRADRLKNTLIEFDHRFPLIEKGLTKKSCHAILEFNGIRRPKMYDLGYPNNNCIGCVKGGMGYWNKIRDDFPEVFELRARREREIGHSCIKGVFLDELEPGRGICNPVVPDCLLDCWVPTEIGE